ncbi:hypothetical protein D5R40_32440 [Okeania hirsuta]|uniref:FkbM family methyltransferase n=1 Tax=Okeania hirsuta TaxID=1458930 RepID=A0A3N6PU29_9CYAN|nr:hypothetical protein D5R40_32440 [Okeania hirsuta]
MISKILKDAPPEALVFDIGASLGDISEIFVELGHQVIAIEPAPSNIRRLQARFSHHQQVKVVKGCCRCRTV